MTTSSRFLKLSACALLFSAALSSCGGGGTSPEQHQQGVEAALSVKDWTAAVTKADAALLDPAVSKDAAKAWRFESLRLTALAEGGKGAEVLASLTRLSATYKAQLTPSLYRSMADKLKAGGDGEGAISVLDAAIKAFPDDPSFQAAIETLKTSADPAEIEKLKALGYL
jgi:hypothetical protein